MIDIKKIQKKLKINFKNEKLLIRALTHKSANQKINNEKLEFLGDRVIGLVLSKRLFDLYPSVNEGILDKRFARLVNKKTCCEVAWSINLQDYIYIGDHNKKISIKDEKILSDCCESLIGAIYIDQGFNFVKDYVLKIWKDKLKVSDITILDSKTKLQEHSLKNYKKLPIYKLELFSGPKHKPIFKISVSIHNSKKIIGTGSSKQLAELDGAAKLLKEIKVN